MNFEDELRERFTVAGEAIPRRPLDWVETYTRARRVRTIYRTVVALATAGAAAAGALGAQAIMKAWDDEKPIPPAKTSSPSPDAATASPDRSPDESRDNPVSFEAPFRAAERFLQGAAQGNVEAMWAVMTESSRAVFGNDIERFRTDALSAIQEGWGWWPTAAGFAMHWQQLPSFGEGSVGVVTLMGSGRPEGQREPYAAAAIPVRVDAAGRAKVEPFVSRGVFEFEAPRDPTTGDGSRLDAVPERNPSFEAVLPGGPDAVHMVVAPVADEPAFSDTDEATVTQTGANRVRAVWTRDVVRMVTGEFFLTVVGIYDGSMQADSVRFRVK